MQTTKLNSINGAPGIIVRRQGNQYNLQTVVPRCAYSCSTGCEDQNDTSTAYL